MMEGGMPIDMGVNSVSQGAEGKEVTQEDMVRVSESMQKAAQMGSQIRGDSQKNAQIAKFLEFLFGQVKSDSIWEIIVELCSKTDGGGMNMTLAINELVILLQPFFSHQFKEHGLQHIFQHEIPDVYPITIDNYITYIRDVRQYYPLIQQMDSDTLAALIVALIDYFGYGSVSEDKKNEILDGVKEKLG